MADVAPDIYRALFDTAPDATFLVDARGRIVLANAQAERLFGWGREEFVGETVEMLIPERLRTTHAGERAAYSKAPTVRHMGSGMHLVALRRDGSEIPVEVALGPIASPGERLFVATVRDVSDIARSRQAAIRGRYNLYVARFGMRALREPDFPALLAAAPALIAEAMRADAVIAYMRTPDGRAIRGVAGCGIAENALALSTVPNDPAWLPGYVLQRREPLLVPDVASEARFGFSDAMRALGLRSTVCVPLLAGEEAIGALSVWNRMPSRWGDDDIHFMQAIANTLSAANQRALAEEQLMHAQRLEALGQLTGGVAHDFNNLLMVISGSLQMIDDIASDRPIAVELARQAMGATDRGAALTRKLLAFARKQPLNPVPVDLNHLVTDFRDLVQRTLGERVSVRIDLDPGLPTLVTDPAQVETALLNLALNARDAMLDGGELVLETAQDAIGSGSNPPELAPGLYARLSVRDTGMGMSPEVLAHAIEPFFTTKEAGKGSGLGLSMVYGFARQSGGTAVIRSTPGKGTTVVLYLPLPAERHDLQNPSRGLVVPSGSETVLVVEDDAPVLEIAAAFLGKLGYRVLKAREGEAALRVLREEPGVELVFTDVSLPGMDGVTLAQAARELRPGLPVLFTSAYLSSSAVERLPAEERIGVLPKPYRREELAFRVRSAIAQRDRRS